MIRLSSSDNQWSLDGPFYSLGRSKTASLQVNKSGVSRVQMFFFNDPQRGMLVGDAGSRNGTLLNGELLLNPKPLQDADHIEAASESLYVSFEAIPDPLQSARGAVESVVLICCRFDDSMMDYGEESRKRSRAKGEWFYRTMKLIMTRRGSTVELTDDFIVGLWDKVEQTDKDRISDILECARQINAFSRHHCEALRAEWGMDESIPLFSVHTALHYGRVKRKADDAGRYSIESGELETMRALADKARELGCSLIGSERFPSQPDDRSLTIPMCMAEIGARRNPMVLFPLREN